MPSIYDSIDLSWSTYGDYIIDEDGDLKDTRQDVLDSFKAEILNIVSSEIGDYELHNDFGSSLSEFQGRMNTRQTAKDLEQRLITSLTVNDIVSFNDLTVKVIPVDYDSVAIFIDIEVAATIANQLDPGEEAQLAFIYNFKDSMAMFIDKEFYTNIIPATEEY